MARQTFNGMSIGPAELHHGSHVRVLVRWRLILNDLALLEELYGRANVRPPTAWTWPG